MKSAFRKDDSLLLEISRAREAGESRLWWLGQSGFLVRTSQGTILFDPYLSDSLTKKYENTDKPHVRITERVIAPERLTGIDVITSSHLHTDHCDPETLLPILKGNPRAKLLIPRANRKNVLDRLGGFEESFVDIDAGEEREVAGLRFAAVPAAHNEIDRNEQGEHRCLGLIALLEGLTIYHSGDTLVHADLVEALERFSIDVALLPINGNLPERRVAGNMNGPEAAALAKRLKVGLVIPHHFDMFAFNTVSPTEFEDACTRLGQSMIVLDNGSSYSFASMKSRLSL
jgi:L-ascorbate metabolism protein UlaG (beta-lactamase superfamily)